MKRHCIALLFALLGFTSPGALGYSSDGSAIGRNFNHSVACTNSTVVVTVSFTNAQSTPIRGFFYTEQLPSTLPITTMGVTLNGLAVTNFAFESGLKGDVYANCIPYRWVLEQPTNFIQANPIPPMGWLQIVYSVSSSTATAASLNQFTWADIAQAATNAAFGYSETNNYQNVSFISNSPSSSLSAQATTNGWRLQLNALIGCSFAIQASTNLLNWDPLTTNISPFTFIDSNAPAYSQRYYRGFWVR